MLAVAAAGIVVVATQSGPTDEAKSALATPVPSAPSATSTIDLQSPSGSNITDAPDAPDEPASTEPTSEAVTPQDGDWQIENLPGSMDCGGSGFPLTGDEIQLATFEVTEDGTSIDVDTEDDTLDVTLERIAVTASFTTYEGSVDITAMGDTPPDIEEFDLVFTMDFDSPTHAAGEMTGTFSAAGMSCAISRPADASFVGPTS